MIGRWLRAPALHFAILGLVIFVLVSPPRVTPSPRLIVPASRIDRALQEYQNLSDHPLEPGEKRAIIQAMVDQEVLYAYALRLGMGKEPAVERRLAQIAIFVADNPHEAKTREERAQEAVLLGLGAGDMVVRRILIDGARRLIRAAVLVREPTDAALEGYLREHPDEFRTVEQWHISQVLVDARQLLERLRKERVPPAEAASHGDPGFVPARLPALSRRELARRFGYRFGESLSALPTGVWEGPIPSRFGFHLVFVEDYRPSQVPKLVQVRKPPIEAGQLLFVGLVLALRYGVHTLPLRWPAPLAY